MFWNTGDPAHWLSNEGFLVTTELTTLFVILFTIEFLNLKEQMPRLYSFFKYYRVFQIANILLIQFYSYEIGAKTASLSVLVSMSCLIYAGVRSSLRKYRPAYFYTLAFISILIGNLVVSLKYGADCRLIPLPSGFS